MKNLEGFVSVCNSRRLKQRNAVLKIAGNSFKFNAAIIREMQAERYKLMYNESEKLVAVVACKDGVKAGDTSVIISNQTLRELIKSILPYGKQYVVNGEFIKEANAFVFDLKSAKEKKS